MSRATGAQTEGKLKWVVTATRWEIETLAEDGAAGYLAGTGPKAPWGF